VDEVRLATILAVVEAELLSAMDRFGAFASAHEGYAVILEELDELWAAIKDKEGVEIVRGEAVQLAAMAIRFLYDIACESSEPKAPAKEQGKGQPAPRHAKGDKACVECGCTEANACLDTRTGAPCSWVPADKLPPGMQGPLCSACLRPVQQRPRPAGKGAGEKTKAMARKAGKRRS